MRFLFDTVVFIWAVESPERISRQAMIALQDHQAMREISAVSLSEIAIKQAKCKITLREEDVSAGIADLKLRVLP